MTKTMREDWDKFVKENHANFGKDANGIRYEFYEDDLLEFITNQLQSVFEEIEKCFSDYEGKERTPFDLGDVYSKVMSLRQKYCNSELKVKEKK